MKLLDTIFKFRKGRAVCESTGSHRIVGHQSGFTLIEALIYLALFGFIMGSLSVAVYGLVEASGRGDTRVVMQEEGGFLLGKIDWALSGASSLTVVASPPSLAVTKYGFGANPLVFNMASGNLRLQQGGGAFVNLNSSSVQVLNFTVTNSAAANGKPQGVTVAFTLRGTTPKGVTIDQNFTTTKFLRK